jgi:dipeptidase E
MVIGAPLSPVIAAMLHSHAMKLLLTSAGITNPSIEKALIEMLGKPISECSALTIPTSSYGMRMIGPERAWVFIAGQEPRTPMAELGWRSIGNLELTALPSVPKDYWVPLVQETDVILVNGGDPMFLSYWMEQSGFAELLPTLTNTVYVGLSAGSMVMSPRIGEDSVKWQSPAGNDKTLGLVDFAMFPHLENPGLPDNTMSNFDIWAPTMQMTCFAIDDMTAIRWVDGEVDVISEGLWKRFDPS